MAVQGHARALLRLNIVQAASRMPNIASSRLVVVGQAEKEEKSSLKPEVVLIKFKNKKTKTSG